MLTSPGGLGPGVRIGPYEIVAPLGEGGMGVVYRATDTRLKRDVAVKVLPSAVRADPERLARFRREAELLAALNHPHIAHVYGLEQADGEHALVMELADGVTLADMIAAGPLPPDEALAIARQLLDALDAAHERGIVHRDLKPANIKVASDGTVKVLDFGLAKALEVPPGPGSVAAAATITSPAQTAMGLILGTAAYMAPEQARGRAVDRRADLWAFGCVLYEMLTGTRAFGGEDVTETLAGVLKSDARMNELPAATPPRVRQVIAACLQKDPRQRLAGAQDARLLLDGAFEPVAVSNAPPASVTPIWRRALPYTIGALATALVMAGVGWRLTTEQSTRQVTRFAIALPDEQEFRSTGRAIVTVAPDGSALLYNTFDGLRHRQLNELESRVVPGTEPSLTNPVFSPDGDHVAFYSTVDRQVKRLPMGGGAAQVIARDIENPLGMDWTETGVLLLALRSGIARVPETGGTPELIITSGDNERLALPQLLPDGGAVLLTRVIGETPADGVEVVVHSLRTGQRTKLFEGARDARYLDTGHLVYAVADDLFAVPFDPASFTTRGAAIELVQGIWWRSALAVVANWSVSSNGTLVYVPNLPIDAARPVWVSRNGAAALEERLPAAEAPRLSADGTRLLVEVDNDIWTYEVQTGRRTRLTSDRVNSRPAWHPTGRQIAYNSTRDGSPEAWLANADGTGPHRQLTDMPGPVHVDSWSPDGTTLAFHHHRPGNAPTEILTITPEDPAATPRPLVQGGFAAEDAVFSPDGRYVAYVSADTGGREVYIRPFPGPGAQVPISVGGGREPVWGRTGELFYRTPTGQEMMAVRVTTTPTLNVGTPTRLFQGDYFIASAAGSPRPQYDVTPDGQRFLMLQPDRSVKPQIVVVQNWFEELRRAVPTR